MTNIDKHIVDTYTGLLEGLSVTSKIEIIDRLTQSLNNERKINDNSFFQSFGAFSSEQSPERIIADIKSSRTFRKKDINI